jgi:hypothetical protein
MNSSGATSGGKKPTGKIREKSVWQFKSGDITKTDDAGHLRQGRAGGIDALQLVMMAPMPGVSYRPVRALLPCRSCDALQSSLNRR